MQRKPVNAYNAGKSYQNQELIYQHMCNHYRRILNAKKSIDNSPPYCYKLKKQGNPPTSQGAKTVKTSRNPSPLLTDRSSVNSCKGSCWGAESYVGSSRYHVACVQDGSASPVKYACVDMDLVDRIAYDTKHGPAAYCDEGWMEVKAQHNARRFHDARKNKSETSSPPVPKRRLPIKSTSEVQQKRKFLIQRKSPQSDIMITQKQFFTSSNKFRPRILKTEAVSKLRSMRVYYPPRRKESRTKNENIPRDATTCNCTKICVCDANENDFKKPPGSHPKEQSQTSSRDSAYNGGVSSLPESRSPTPDQRSKVGCCCHVSCDRCYSRKKEKVLRIHNEKDQSPRSPAPGSRPSSPEPKTSEEEKSLKKMKEDALYVKFVQDITVEVLEKCLYTNKALKKVMRRHLMENLKTLNKERMIKELESLRIQLGIPEDDAFLNLGTDLEEGSAEVNLYPVISDSEFVLPQEEGSPVKLPGDIPKSLSEVLLRDIRGSPNRSNSSDDSEVPSVVQVGKEVRGRRRNSLGNATAVVPSSINSGFESDHSSELRKRQRMPPGRRPHPKTSYSSSSESEESGKKFACRCSELCKFHRGATDRDFEKCTLKRSSSLILDRKTRNVSFKNRDFQMTRNVEFKQSTTVISSKRKDDKPK